MIGRGSVSFAVHFCPTLWHIVVNLLNSGGVHSINDVVSKIFALMIIFLVLATATVYTQSAFATNANGVKGGTPCTHSGDVVQHNPVTMPTMTILVCDD
jgi:hypothetical protein